MRTPLLLLTTAALACAPATAEDAPPTRAEVGQPAPDFTLTSLDGDEVSLSDHEGKVVVLEWFNPECPYIVHAHDGGPLSTLMTKWTEQGVVWLTINSNVPGTQGSDLDLNRAKLGEWGIPGPLLVDRDGAVGKAYGAKVTPHMYIVDAQGTLVYDGALDNAPLGNPRGSDQVEPWLEQALTAVASGEDVPRARNKPYGCSVKYGG